MKRFLLFPALLLSSLLSCVPPVSEAGPQDAEASVPFFWENANVYFLLTDRFHNGKPENDVQLGRTQPTAPFRGFMGGDIAGITQKIEAGYFDSLGINAIWFTPVVEQNKGLVDEGTGETYAYHGYWAQDWTALDPNFGTEAELMTMVETAHAHGIRVLLDVVLNHTGPVTEADPVWPEAWVRTGPKCAFTTYENTTSCTLVENLPDIRTEQDAPVDLPKALVKKWEQAGRLEQEEAELDAFFDATGYPRAPRYYLIKWLTDFIRTYGVDGFRIDTAKHLEETVWAELRKEADRAFAAWKRANPQAVLDDNDFYFVGEVYNYRISDSLYFNFGDSLVNFFDHGMTSLINFDFKQDAHEDYETLFSKYDHFLQGPMKGKSVLNYISSHDDGQPFDPQRAQAIAAGTRLLLCPGGVQIYYGDETARPLTAEGAEGDANLRSFMNWDDLAADTRWPRFSTRQVLTHWRKLGRFRRDHPAVGAGIHEQVSASPYVFSRRFARDGFEDKVLVGLDLPAGPKTLPVNGLFAEGTRLKDYYSGQEVTVGGDSILVDTPHDVVLLGLGLR